MTKVIDSIKTAFDSGDNVVFFLGGGGEWGGDN